MSCLAFLLLWKIFSLLNMCRNIESLYICIISYVILSSYLFFCSLWFLVINLLNVFSDLKCWLFVYRLKISIFGIIILFFKFWCWHYSFFGLFLFFPLFLLSFMVCRVSFDCSVLKFSSDYWVLAEVSSSHIIETFCQSHMAPTMNLIFFCGWIFGVFIGI